MPAGDARPHPRPGGTRRAWLAASVLALLLPPGLRAQSAAAKAPSAPARRSPAAAPAPQAPAQRWWVELRLSSEDEAEPAGAVHYRSQGRAPEPLLQLQLAPGERARFALEQEQPWAWTEAVWAPASAAAPAAAASAPAASASAPGSAGGVLQSLQWSRQVQALECELLPAAARRPPPAPGAATVGLRLRLLWSGAAQAAATLLETPPGSERVALQAELSVPVQQWVLLARGGTASGASAGDGQGARHYGAGSARALASPVRALYLRLRPVDPGQ